MERWIAIVALVAGGCSECHVGESRCGPRGLIYSCAGDDVGGGLAFREIDSCCGSNACLDLELDGDRVAVCSASGSAQDSRCAGRDGDVCVDATTSLLCEAGYGSYQTACPGACVEPMPGEAFCAEVASDARCAEIAGTGSTCDGGELLACQDGALISDTPCQTACVAPAPGEAFCSTGTAPDPRCAAGPAAWCDGDLAMTCTTGGLIEVETCAADAPCTITRTPDGSIATAWCNAPNTTGCPAS
ncbi:MAG TPA: hypothetical protein VLX92_06820 [Kofleriaceae bacterium]|nr:hypothetical protein [Kofleriaceae bacterium]